MKTIDLHTHSTASDGTDSPEELITKASAAGLSAIALTDHDTLDGLKQAEIQANKLGIELIKGIEISATHTDGEIHILGYWFNESPENITDFQKILQQLVEFRNERNAKLFENFRRIGIPLSYDEVAEFMGEQKLLCRPHFALALLKRGIVSNLREAFVNYLGTTGKAYASKEKLPPEEVVQILKNSNALVSLAHPYLITCHSEQEREDIIARLAASGLNAIEAYYSLNNQEETEKTLYYAKKYGLGISGGSDYHGKIKPNISVGSGLGNLKIDYEVLANLKG